MKEAVYVPESAKVFVTERDWLKSVSLTSQNVESALVVSPCNDIVNGEQPPVS